MTAYLVAVFTYPDRAAAEQTCAWLGANGAPASIHDAPPVILAGLVKGGEYATMDEWLDGGGEVLCIAADGRIVGVEDNDCAVAAEARGALPITWYRYEAP